MRRGTFVTRRLNYLGEFGVNSSLELFDSHVARMLVGEVKVDSRLA